MHATSHQRGTESIAGNRGVVGIPAEPDEPGVVAGTPLSL
jgi:hypothetical protein